MVVSLTVTSTAVSTQNSLLMWSTLDVKLTKIWGIYITVPSTRGEWTFAAPFNLARNCITIASSKFNFEISRARKKLKLFGLWK